MPATPPVTCDTTSMASLKSTLEGMITAQQDSNAALAAMVYTTQVWPHTPPKPPSPPPPSPQLGGCIILWGQCGGKQYTGNTCCEKGSCVYQNPWYSQCRTA